MLIFAKLGNLKVYSCLIGNYNDLVIRLFFPIKSHFHRKMKIVTSEKRIDLSILESYNKHKFIGKTFRRAYEKVWVYKSLYSFVKN